MPCNDYPSPSTSSLVESHDRETARLESMLCSACRVLEQKKFDFDTNPRLSEWWADHKAADERKEAAEIKKRLRREQAIALTKKPINQLTKQEIRLLKEFQLI